MNASLTKRSNGKALLCLLALLMQFSCKKNVNNGSDPNRLSPEEVNALTIDSSYGPAYYASVANAVPQAIAVIHVEAEDYTDMSGIMTEDCREGGKDVGYISKGDWMEYQVDVPSSDDYSISFRVAGPGGKLQVQLPDGSVLATADLPATPGGQIYDVGTARVTLNAGKQTLRIYALTTGWNFNWFELMTQEDANLVAQAQANQTILLASDFEEEKDFKDWNKEVCRNDAVRISSDVARTGKTSARFEFTKNDVINFNFLRAEIRRNCETEDERWYGFSNYLPADFVSDPLAEKIAQWHDVPDFVIGESWRSPPISFGIVNDHYYIQMLWATNAINTDLTRSGEKKADLGQVDRSRWNDWVFHIKFSYKSDGIMEIWKNKVKIFSYYGPNSYNDQSYPYFKIGIYKWGWNGWADYSPENKRVLYYDEVKIGNKNSGVDDVSPE
jgi:hypothetical protein